MKSLLRLRGFIRPYWHQVLLALLALVFMTVMSLTIPLIIQEVIDKGLVDRDTQLLITSALILLVIGIVESVLMYWQRYLTERVASQVGYDLRNRMYDHIQRLSFTYHDHAETGQLISRTIEDVRSIERFTGNGIVDLIHLILLFIGIAILLYTANPRLATIALLPMVPLVWVTTNFGRKIGGYFLAVDNSLGELSSRLQENVLGVQVVRAFAREPYENDRFNHTNRILYDARITVIREWSRIMPTSHLLVILSTILILWFGGGMVISGEMTIGEMVAFNSYLLMLAEPARQLTWLVNMAGEAVAGVNRTFEVLDHEPAIQTQTNATVLPQLSGKVSFQDVSLAYQGETTHALCDINLNVEPNQVIALIGSTGSGKTSLVNLISRFYDPNQGAILVDDINIRDVDLVSLRDQIGIVLQTSLLFSVSIRENIAYGRPGASEDEIIEAAKAAQADDFINSLPAGYDTIVGERGITLSGGQRQRVAIARALLMDPRILILDDSTSSVDMQTERLIQKALWQLMQGRTTFIIAHRLSTVQRADLILVMQNGQIIERGTHRELISKGGLYREICDLQLRDREKFQQEVQAMEGISTRYSESNTEDWETE
ncbi:MAG: ABC transporter ATP-binding protein [Anaerolineales bacterium]|jgi:ATP-binding cassette subfamily B protein